MGYNTSEILEKVKPLQLRLKQWHANLPPSLSMEETKARKLSSSGFLHLAYFTAEVTLHRAIIRSLDDPNTDPNLKLIARNAAKMRFTSVVDFVNKLRPEHLQAFWFSASKINLAIIGTFGSLLWASSESKEEAEFYKSQLADYRWTLRVSGAEFMKYTVEMLDASVVFAMDPPIKATTFRGSSVRQSHNYLTSNGFDDAGSSEHEMDCTQGFQGNNVGAGGGDRTFSSASIAGAAGHNWHNLAGGIPTGGSPETWDLGGFNYDFSTPGGADFLGSQTFDDLSKSN